MKRFVPAIPLAVLVALYVSSELADVDGRGTTAVARAVSADFLIGPTVAAWAAWRASALRRGRISQLAPSRSALAVAARQLIPVLAGGLSVLVFAVALALLVGGPIVSTPDLRIVATGAAVIVGHAALGYALGHSAPAVVAVPAAFLALYLWMVFPHAWEPLWLRHLNGYSYSCCGLSSDFDLGALIAPALVASGLVAVSWLVVVDTGSLRWRLAAGLAVSGLAGIGGAALVSDLGPDPVRPRSSSDLVCVSGQPRVCAWPENAHRIGDIAAEARGVRTALASLGTSVPDTLTEAVPANSSETGWYFGMRPITERRLIYGMIVSGLVPEHDDCFPHGRDLRSTMIAWLAIKTGLDRADVAGGLGDAELGELDSVLERPERSQLDWYRRGRVVLDTCVSSGQPDHAR